MPAEQQMEKEEEAGEKEKEGNTRDKHYFIIPLQNLFLCMGK